MIKKFICLLVAAIAMGALPLFAQEGTAKAAEATLTLDKKTYTLSRALAYETTIDNEEVIVVVLSGQPVASEQFQEAREKEKEGNDPEFKRPFLRLVFTKTGEFKNWNAAAGGASVGRRSGKATGELKLQDGRVSGKAGEPPDTGGIFVMAFDARFDVALLKAGDSLASTAKKGGPAANVKPSVTGVFKGNGKEAKLAYVSARWGEPFSGKPGIELVFSEKDHSQAKKPDFDAAFGKFGSALIISLFEDGQIYGCQVVHSAHQKQGFSSTGNIEATSFAYEDGKVEGEITTSGQLDTFGEKWEVKIKFIAPLGEIPKELQPAESKKPKKEEKPAASDDDDEEKPTSQAPGSEFKAKDLALTKDATDIEYKALVGHIVFKSKTNVKSVCAELVANLKAQGWTNDGGDMIQPQSSILRRKRGAATLTIFVKPENGGSEVTMMTEGLSWDGQ